MFAKPMPPDYLPRFYFQRPLKPPFCRLSRLPALHSGQAPRFQASSLNHLQIVRPFGMEHVSAHSSPQHVQTPNLYVYRLFYAQNLRSSGSSTTNSLYMRGEFSPNPSSYGPHSSALEFRQTSCLFSPSGAGRGEVSPRPPLYGEQARLE